MRLLAIKSLAQSKMPEYTFLGKKEKNKRKDANK